MSIIQTVMSDPVYLYESFAVLSLYPAVRIFQRAGLKPWYAALLLVPAVGLIICTGILALSKWPERNAS